MKRFLYILVALVLAATTLTSCEKSPEEILVGKWELTLMKASFGGVNIEINPAEAGMALTLIFNADGSYSITESIEGESMSESGTYVYNETSSVITFISNEDSYSIPVHSIDDEQLVMIQEEDGQTSYMYFDKK